MRPLVEGIDGRAIYQPETFRGVTELQGGWFSQVGGKLASEQGLNAAQIAQLTLTAIERGCTSINYYMFYGGSNFGLCGARMQTQTYDYNAPLREWGEQGSRYHAVKAIGQMLKEHGEQLIRSKPIELNIEGDHPDVSIYLRQSDDGSQFFFVRNSKQDESRAGTVTIRRKDGPTQTLNYALGNFEAKVLYVPPDTKELTDGQWLPQPIEPPAAAPPSVRDAIPVRVASIAAEGPGRDWHRVPAGSILDLPVFSTSDMHTTVSHPICVPRILSLLWNYLLSRLAAVSPSPRESTETRFP